jgi:hypothetical protein
MGPVATKSTGELEMRYEIVMEQFVRKQIAKEDRRVTYSEYEAKEIFESIDWKCLKERYCFSRTFPVRVSLIAETLPNCTRTVVNQKTLA